MRISLLENREDFYRILRTTLEETTFFKNRKGLKEKRYYVNKYLNFIASKSLPVSVFQTLINEYSSSLTWWKKGIQLVYVKLATSKFFRSFFAQGNIWLPEDFSEYLIVGGNHRVRLFYGELKFSIVILKSGESQKFIDNDIAVRTENNLSYAPQIFDSDIDWLREEYFNGIPFNRLESDKKQENLHKVIIKNHFEELLSPTSKEVPLKEYIQFVKTEIFDLLSNEKLKVNKDLSEMINKVFETLLTKLSNNVVQISWSHGDFQAANILVSEGNYKVIDWEASNKRFYLYDVFTFLSKIRTNISLALAIDNFKKSIKELENVYTGTEDKIILLLIEELRFNINEEFSENYYSSGRQTKKLCHSIVSYIYD